MMMSHSSGLLLRGVKLWMAAIEPVDCLEAKVVTVHEVQGAWSKSFDKTRQLGRIDPRHSYCLLSASNLALFGAWDAATGLFQRALGIQRQISAVSNTPIEKMKLAVTLIRWSDVLRQQRGAPPIGRNR